MIITPVLDRGNSLERKKMRAEEIKKNLRSGEYDNLLNDIYVDEGRLGQLKERYEKAADRFVSLFGDEEISIFSAPGRSEVGGNHTDHQHGEVLAASINLDAIAFTAKKDDGIIRIVSDDYPMVTIDTSDIEKNDSEEGTTIALIKGVLKGSLDRGFKIGGFDSFIKCTDLLRITEWEICPTRGSAGFVVVGFRFQGIAVQLLIVWIDYLD